VTILLTSLKTPPWDLGQFRSQGIEPTAFRVIGIKAAVGHRQAYDPIAKSSHTVQTPGPCSSRLTDFPYKRLHRPIYPLDEIPPGRASPAPSA
jgi:microcystin degradation protein MlrC